MLGRELIKFIMENHLEDEEIFKNGKLVGHLSEDEAAAKFGVGVTTIYVWVNQGRLPGIRINEGLHIPFNAEDPRLTEEDSSSVLARCTKEV